MTQSFDLVTQPWLPVRWLDGRTTEVSLSHLLTSAHQIEALEGDNPLVTAALTRLLLAVVHRVVGGPADDDVWQNLWEDGHFDRDAVARYFQAWPGRFDLLSETHPFLQTPGLAQDAKGVSSIARLTFDRASDRNSAYLFDHTIELALSLAEAARHLVAFQAFDTGGALTPWSGAPETQLGNRDGLMCRAAVMIARGDNLFETLLFNTVSYDPTSQQPEGTGFQDRPAWEREPIAFRTERTPDGWLDLLTWRSRAVELVMEMRDGEAFAVSFMSHCGEQFPRSLELVAAHEQMTAAIRLRKPQEGRPPYATLGVDPSRAVWRDSLALLAGRADEEWGYRMSRTLAQLARRRSRGYGPSDRQGVVPIDVIGLAAEQAKLFLWRHERLAPPLAAFLDADLVSAVQSALQLAERAARLLGTGGPLAMAADVPVIKDGRPSWLVNLRDRKIVVGHYGDETGFWGRLDSSFTGFLAGLGDDPEEAEDQWAADVRRAARASFETSLSPFRAQARSGLAAARAQRAFDRRLRKLFSSHLEAVA